jgi:hypothetical protein
MKRRSSKLKKPKKAPKKTVPRNGSALPAKMRNGGGPHKNKADKRKNENHNPDYANEEY